MKELEEKQSVENLTNKINYIENIIRYGKTRQRN